jgi:hypothetical protein
MRDHEDDPNFEDGMLKDGHTFRVPHRMLDGVSRSVRDHYAHQPRDRAGPRRVSDQFGSPLGLHRPGYRLGDALVPDGQQAEIERAYAAYDARVSRAYLLDQDENGDEEELAGREAELHAALTGAGGSPDDVSEYLENLDDDELLTGDVGYHLAAFRRRYNSQDAARRQRDRLQRLYDQRDAETSAMWKQNR